MTNSTTGKEIQNLNKLISEILKVDKVIKDRTLKLKAHIDKIEKELNDTDRIFTFNEANKLGSKIQITDDILSKLSSYCEKYKTLFTEIVNQTPILEIKIELPKNKYYKVTREEMTVYEKEKPETKLSFNELPNAEKEEFKNAKALKETYLRHQS